LAEICIKCVIFVENCKNRTALGAPPPDCLASGDRGQTPGSWGLRSKTPNSLWQLGAPPPDPVKPLPLKNSGYAAGATPLDHKGTFDLKLMGFILL